ncbi:hypothetical protein TNCV_4027671 [Trichonephila clavipes]|nr:hypothetical protein TNCV_4027671 [Trichonephila clavipes]
MSSRHHIDDLCVAELLERSKKGRKITDVARGVRHRSRRCFTAVGVILKLLECVVDGTGRSVLSTYDACRRQIYHPISKGNRRTEAQQVANQFLAASESESPEKLLPDV